MGRNRYDDLVCDVCGCVTGHLTLAKPPERPQDECQRCYWTRTLDLARVTAERDALRAEVEAMRRCLADTCHAVLTSPAVTDTLWTSCSDLVTVVDDIATVLGIDTVAPEGGPSAALDALRARKVGG